MAKARILLIEDDDEARILYGLLLRQWGYEAFSAPDGKSGIELAYQCDPDLILLDIMMPGMDGYEVGSQLRTDARFNAIPIIYLTALDDLDSRVKAYAIGGDDFVNKSGSTPQELRTRIEATLIRTKRIQYNWTATFEGIVVGLLSFSGGVGVSTLAINLAQCAAAQNQQPVILLDLSLPVGHLGIWAGVRGSRHLIELISRPADDLNITLINHFSLEHARGFSFIPGPATLVNMRAVQPHTLLHLLELLRNAGYFVILDMGRPALPLLWKAPGVCDWVGVVTSADPVSRHLSSIALRALPAEGVKDNALLLLFNNVTGAAMTDTFTSLPRRPDFEMPFRPDLKELPDPSPLMALWNITRNRPAQ